MKIINITRSFLNLKFLSLLIVPYFVASIAVAGDVTGPLNKGRVTAANSSTTKTLKVVVSIPPFYALVSEIMKNSGVSPSLVIKAGASVHHAVLSPKDVQMLDEADIIFWGGPNLETFLVNPLKVVKNQNKSIVELDKTAGIQWLSTRYSPNFKSNEAADEHAHEEEGTRKEEDHSGHSDEHTHHHDHGPIDMHFWLDPNNALLLVDAITSELCKRDAEHCAIYEKNAAILKNEIKSTDLTLKQKLSSVKDKPYLVFHDGYQYFEHHYGLNAVGAITADPELPVSIERLKTIRNIIEADQVECVFSEPNTNPKLVQSLAKDFHLRMGVLDPMESPEPSKNLSYPALLEGLSDSLVSCLKGQQ